MIIKVPLFIENEDCTELMKGITMEMVKTIIETYNSTECSNECFENVILI